MAKKHQQAEQATEAPVAEMEAAPAAPPPATPAAAPVQAEATNEIPIFEIVIDPCPMMRIPALTAEQAVAVYEQKFGLVAVPRVKKREAKVTRWQPPTT